MGHFELHGPLRVHTAQQVRYELELAGDHIAHAIDTLVMTANASRGFTLAQTQHFESVVGSARYLIGGPGRFPIDLAIPPFPSHTTPFAWAGLVIDVRTELRGRTATALRFPIHVCERIENTGPMPAVVRNKQHVELVLALGATRATGGTTLVGECSIADIATDTRVTLEVVQTIRAVTGHAKQIVIHTSKLQLPRHAAATGVPFTIQLPPYLAPTLAIDTHQIQYEVRATHKQWRGSTAVSIPIHIVDAFPAPAKIKPPHAGEHQVDKIFAEIAARDGWRVGPSVDPDPELGTIMPWLFAAQSGLVMRLGYAFRDDGSTFLISRIRYRPLELGLTVVPSRADGTLSSGIAAWDRDHCASARDFARGREILTTVVPEIGPLGALVRWDDDWLICERPVTEVDDKLVDEVAAALRVVARTLAHAIKRDELDVGPYR